MCSLAKRPSRPKTACLMARQIVIRRGGFPRTKGVSPGCCHPRMDACHCQIAPSTWSLTVGHGADRRRTNPSPTSSQSCVMTTQDFGLLSATGRGKAQPVGPSKTWTGRSPEAFVPAGTSTSTQESPARQRIVMIAGTEGNEVDKGAFWQLGGIGQEQGSRSSTFMLSIRSS